MFFVKVTVLFNLISQSDLASNELDPNNDCEYDFVKLPPMHYFFLFLN